MAFLFEENSLCISYDHALLMSFLEESTCEEYNHEDLDSLMRSFEAEINPNTMDVQDSMMESENLGFESVDDLDIQLGDLGLLPYPSPSDDVNYWDMETEGDKVGTLIEIGDDYCSDIYFDEALEGKMYTSSWIEIDAIEVYA